MLLLERLQDVDSRDPCSEGPVNAASNNARGIKRKGDQGIFVPSIRGAGGWRSHIGNLYEPDPAGVIRAGNHRGVVPGWEHE